MKNLKSIRDAAEKATQGEWLIHIDEDKEPTNIYSKQFSTGCDESDETYNTVCSFPVEKIGYGCAWDSEKNAKYISLANPSTMIKLLDYIQDLERCVEVQKIALQEIGKPVSLDDHILTRPLDNMSDANESLTTVEGILKKYDE